MEKTINEVFINRVEKSKDRIAVEKKRMGHGSRSPGMNTMITPGHWVLP